MLRYFEPSSNHTQDIIRIEFLLHPLPKDVENTFDAHTNSFDTGIKLPPEKIFCEDRIASIPPSFINFNYFNVNEYEASYHLLIKFYIEIYTRWLIPNDWQAIRRTGQLIISYVQKGRDGEVLRFQEVAEILFNNEDTKKIKERLITCNEILANY